MNSKFTTDIFYIGGHGNPVALAKKPMQFKCANLDFQAMAKAQPSDTDLQTIQTSNNSTKFVKITL